jgi:hypothetical protein
VSNSSTRNREYSSSEEILKEKRRPLSRLTSMLDLFKPSARTGTSPRILSGAGYDDPDNPPAVPEESLLPKLSLFVDPFCIFFIYFSISIFLIKIYCLEPPSPF